MFACSLHAHWWSAVTRCIWRLRAKTDTTLSLLLLAHWLHNVIFQPFPCSLVFVYTVLKLALGLNYFTSEEPSKISKKTKMLSSQFLYPLVCVSVSDFSTSQLKSILYKANIFNCAWDRDEGKKAHNVSMIDGVGAILFVFTLWTSI